MNYMEEALVFDDLLFMFFMFLLSKISLPSNLVNRVNRGKIVPR